MSLKRNKKICKGCGKEKYIFSKELCQMCSSSNNTLKSTPLKKTRARIKPITEKKKKEKKEISEKREVYFDYHINRCTHSEEDGAPINNPNRSNICHIFDKGRHPSLQDNLDNYIYLTFKQHEKLDRLLYNHEFERLEKEFPNSFKKICIRGRLLLSLCQENTIFYRKFKEYLDGRTT